MLTWMPELKGRSLLRLASFTDEEMLNLIDLAAQLKARRAAGVRGDLLHRKNIALIFEKSSTRTRNSSIIAARDEGGGAEYLTRPDIHFGKKESVKDTARVLGRIYDGILFRGFAQSTVEELAKWSGVPVWNGLTDDYHPTQILADLLTVRETFGKILSDTRIVNGHSIVCKMVILPCIDRACRNDFNTVCLSIFYIGRKLIFINVTEHDDNIRLAVDGIVKGGIDRRFRAVGFCNDIF